MTLNVTPQLNFRGQAREALEFYQSVFGGEIAAVSYQDAQAVQDPDEADQILWGQVVNEHGVRVMAHDVPASVEYEQGAHSYFVAITGTGADTAQIVSYWNGLIPGSTIIQDLGQVGWSPLHGLVRDRYGVVWVFDLVVSHNT